MKNKNYGIDALKIVSVLFIITTHVLSWGGILYNTKVGETKYFIFWILQAISYVAVNCYALTSGYLNAEKDFKYQKILKLWLQVFFYTFGFAIAFKIFAPELVGTKEIIKSIFPIMFNQYWYFTAYFIVYMFSPLLNFILQKMPKKQLQRLIILLIILFSIIPTIRCYDLFGTHYGYSALWLGVLYMIGGYIKLYINDIKKSTKQKLSIIWAVSTLLTAASRFISDIVLKGRFTLFTEYALFHYTSITVLAASLCLFLIFAFSNIKKSIKKIVSFIAPLTFGVYLIHVNYFIWNYILEGRFKSIANLNVFKSGLYFILIVICIFIICSIIEYIRQLLFKVLRIEGLTNKINSIILKIENKLIKE